MANGSVTEMDLEHLLYVRDHDAQVFKYCSDEVIRSVCECAVNLIALRIPYTPSQLDLLRPYKFSIRKLADEDLSLDEKRHILMEEGDQFLPTLIPMAIDAYTAEEEEEEEHYSPSELLADLELISKNEYRFLNRFPDRVIESLRIITTDFLNKGVKPPEDIRCQLRPYLDSILKIVNKDISLDEKRHMLVEEGEEFLHPLLHVALSTPSEREILSDSEEEYAIFKDDVDEDPERIPIEPMERVLTPEEMESDPEDPDEMETSPEDPEEIEGERAFHQMLQEAKVTEVMEVEEEPETSPAFRKVRINPEVEERKEPRTTPAFVKVSLNPEAEERKTSPAFVKVSLNPDVERQPGHTCSLCQATFMRYDNMIRHQKTNHENKKYTCSVCQKAFSRKDALQRHSHV